MSRFRPIDELLLRAKVEWRERRRWRPVRCPASAFPRVFYGQEHLAARSDVAGGGIIKTQDLAGRFPPCGDRPTILYLISSALPPYAAQMARIARRAGGRVVLNQNGVAYPAWHGPGWERPNRFIRDVMAACDLVIYQSEFCRMAADQFVTVPDCETDILHNPVDTKVFSPVRGTRREDLRTGEPGAFPRLLVAGSLQQPYRAECAVKTLSLLRQRGLDATLHVAGRLGWRPTERECLEEIRAWASADRAEEFIRIGGPYSQTDAPVLFRSADVLLHTTYNDACPRTVVEAMACGLPVVYSSSGGVPELVGPDAGIGIPAPADWERIHPPSAEELADAVVALGKEYGKFSHAARVRAETRFDVRPWLDRHAEWFDRLRRDSPA